MINVILSSNSRLKLEIISFLWTNKDVMVSIRRLSTHFDCSHSKMQAMISEIAQDLSECYPEPVLETEDRIQIIMEDFQYNVYKQFLIRQSIAYKLILSSLMEPDKTLADFCQEAFLSRATVTRNAQPLLQYLKGFDIKLNLSKLNWSGPEAMIRFVFFNFLWLGSHGEDLSTFDSDFEEEQQLIAALEVAASDYIDDKEVLLILVISRLRTEQGNLLAEMPFKQLILPEAGTELINYLSSYIAEEKQRTLQQEFLGYAIFYAPYCLSELDERAVYVEQYFSYLEACEHSLASLVNEFRAFYEKELLDFNIDEATLRLLHINIVKTFLNFSIRKGTVPLSIDFFRDLVVFNNHLFEELSQHLTTFFRRVARRKNFGWLNHCMSSLVDVLTFNLLPYYEHYHEQNKLVIGLVSGNNYLVLQDVKNFLSQFNFLDVRMVTDDCEDLDFLVTAFPQVIETDHKPFFSVDSNSQSNYQMNLFSSLQKAYKEKRVKLI